MAFPPQFLDDIRTRVALSDIVGRHVRLKHHGNEHTGLCPFHDEKTPSFTVNEGKGFFHCFGCGAHGDVIGFVMRSEGMSFLEAVQQLANESGLKVPDATPQDTQRNRHIEELLKLNEVACHWFENCLRQNIGKPAREYLAQRGLNQESIQGFRLGFAPPRGNQLGQFLSKEGVDDELSVAAGLTRWSDKQPTTYDFFRGRIVFPITNAQGQVIAFGGRSLGPSKPKYINSPETEIFRKGRALYNLSQARGEAHRSKIIIVAEGYMDVIALHRAGFKNAVAPLGTALTEDQILQLWRYAPEPILCFDGDEAGIRAARRAAERTLPNLKAGISLAFVFLPSGQDPDSMIANGDREIVAEAIQKPVSLADFLWSRELASQSLDTPERIAAFKKRIHHLILQIKDETIRNGYFSHFRNKMKGHFFSERRGRFFNKKYVPDATTNILQTHARGRDRTGDPYHRERVLVAILVGHPELLSEVRTDFAQIEIQNAQLSQLRSALLEVSANSSRLNYQSIRAQLADLGHEQLIAKLLDRTEWNQTMTEPSIRPETNSGTALAAWRETHALHCQTTK